VGYRGHISKLVPRGTGGDLEYSTPKGYGVLRRPSLLGLIWWTGITRGSMGEESSCYLILNSKGIPPHGSPRDPCPPNQTLVCKAPRRSLDLLAIGESSLSGHLHTLLLRVGHLPWLRPWEVSRTQGLKCGGSSTVSPEVNLLR
jgi:hypothetical protein